MPDLTPQQIYDLIAAGEPEDLRRSYLATPQPGQMLGHGTTTPVLGGIEMAESGNGWMLPPRGLAQQMSDMTKVYATLPMLTDRRLGPLPAVDLLDGHSLEELLRASSHLLRILYQSHPGSPKTQALFVDFLSGQAQKRARAMVAAGNPLVIPQTVLAVQKLALMFDHHPRHPAERAMRDVVLLALDVAYELGSDQTNPGDQTWWGTGLPSSTVMELIQNQIFNHAVHLGTSLTRWRNRRAIGLSYDPDAAKEFDDHFQEFTGCDPDLLFEVGVTAITHINANEVVRCGRQLFDTIQRPPQEIDAALNLLAADASTLRQLVEKEMTEGRFDWTFNSLRRFPMLRCEDGSLMVLNPDFLMERVCGTGYFWEITHGINVRTESGSNTQRKKAKKKLHGRFGSFTGHVAEEYAAARFARIAVNLGLLGKQHWREEELRGFWPTSEGRCCDFLIDGGFAWAAIDVVDHDFGAGVVQGGLLTALEEDLEKIVDEKADQITQTIRRLMSAGGVLPGDLRRVPTPRYFPVIVAPSRFPWNPTMAKAVHGRLAQRGLLQDPLIWPLTVINMDALEYIESVVERGGKSFVAMLEERSETGETEMPFDIYLNHRGGLQLPRSLTAGWQEAFAEVADAHGLDSAQLMKRFDSGTTSAAAS